MSDKNLFDVIENIKETARNKFLEDKNHPTLFFLETTMGIGLMPCFFSNNEEKEKHLDLIKKMIEDGKLSAFIFISEAWMKTMDSISEMREEYKKHGSIRFSPNKEEVLMLQFQSFDKNIFMLSKIIRDGDNVSLGEWKEIDCHNKNGLSMGRFDNLFEKVKAASN